MKEPPESDNATDVTVLLRAWSAGDAEALNQLAPLLHVELKRVARRCLMSERKDHTLQPTALVNEAFLRLVQVEGVEWQDRAHFFALSAQLMRRILVNYARARRTNKRGGAACKIPLEETMIAAPERDFKLLELNEALEKLARLEQRKARIVELHFFAGLDFDETAAVLKVSEKTVRRDWSFSKAWLAKEMRHQAPGVKIASDRVSTI